MAAQVSYLGVQMFDWTGNLHMQRNKASINGKMESVLHAPVQVSADWHADRDSATVSASVDSVPFSMEASGQVKKGHHGPEDFTLKAKGSYALDGGEWVDVGMSGKYGWSTTGTLESHGFQLNVDHPEWPAEISWTTQLSSGYVSNVGKAVVGTSGKNYAFEQVFSSQGSDELLFKVLLASPQDGHEYLVDLGYKVQ